MIRTRTWVILLAAAAMVLAVLSWYLLTRNTGSHVVQIVQDGSVVREIDLSRVSGSETIVLRLPDGGSNTILVQPGRICVCEANCPDQICVHQGWLENQAAPIVCMPHRLVIQIKDGTETDGVSR